MSNQIITRQAIHNAVRKKLESDEFRRQLDEIQSETFKDYCLFFISSALLTLGDKYDWTKEMMLEFQNYFSKNCWSYIKESEDGNSVTTTEILETLKTDYDVNYNREEDRFE